MYFLYRSSFAHLYFILCQLFSFLCLSSLEALKPKQIPSSDFRLCGISNSIGFLKKREELCSTSSPNLLFQLKNVSRSNISRHFSGSLYKKYINNCEKCVLENMVFVDKHLFALFAYFYMIVGSLFCFYCYIRYLFFVILYNVLCAVFLARTHW